jgi:hypothetical protein
MTAVRTLLAILVFSLVGGCISDGRSEAQGPLDDATRSDAPQEDSMAPSDGAGDSGDDSTEPADPAPEGQEPVARAVGQPCDARAAHGDPQRDDGTVSTAPEGSQFVARRTVTIGNDFGGAAGSSLLLATFNGGIAVTPSTDCSYELVADLFGRGATPDDARRALDLLTLKATDALQQGLLSLSFEVTSGTADPVQLPLGLSSSLSNGAALQLAVPPQPSHDVEARSSNGGILVNGLHGPRVEASSSNGGLSVKGSFDEADLGTSNAGIDLDGTFHDIVAGTSNGGISADLEPARSGTVLLSSSNAGISVTLPRDGSAFDITGDTSNGQVRFDLEGREMADRGRGTFRSGDWSSASVQVTIELDTSNASIVVED